MAWLASQLKNRKRRGFVDNDVINIDRTIVIQGRRIACVARQVRVSSEVGIEVDATCAVINNGASAKTGNTIAYNSTSERKGFSPFENPWSVV